MASLDIRRGISIWDRRTWNSRHCDPREQHVQQPRTSVRL